MIQVNDEQAFLHRGDNCFGAGNAFGQLLIQLELDYRKVAVERNEEIVPRSLYGETLLSDGDAIEIVHFIGGG